MTIRSTVLSCTEPSEDLALVSIRVGPDGQCHAVKGQISRGRQIARGGHTEISLGEGRLGRVIRSEGRLLIEQRGGVGVSVIARSGHRSKGVVLGDSECECVASGWWLERVIDDFDCWSARAQSDVDSGLTIFGMGKLQCFVDELLRSFRPSIRDFDGMGAPPSAWFWLANV